MPKPTTEQLRQAIAREGGAELDAAVETIRHCLDQLSEEQVWWRSSEEMNSIANLILHLCGNLRQWIVSGLGGAEDLRNRPDEFSERGPILKSELLNRLTGTVTEAKRTLLEASAENFLQPRRIQSFETNGLGAVFHSVSHFRGHTQEIVHLSRVQLGPAYRFAFVPNTSEQGEEPARTIDAGRRGTPDAGLGDV